MGGKTIASVAQELCAEMQGERPAAGRLETQIRELTGRALKVPSSRQEILEKLEGYEKRYRGTSRGSYATRAIEMIATVRMLEALQSEQ